MESRSIAIDGPSGAGKSTLARRLAGEFGLIYVDTGALYRSVGLYVFRKGISPRDEAAVSAVLPEIGVELVYNDAREQRVILNGEDVSETIRLPEISLYASDVSALPPVRAFLLDMQREMAKKYDIIMDGRDIGTVVLPGAGLKIFLSASPEERARRRFEELTQKGMEVRYDDVLADMRHRDENDTTRAAAPLRPAEDAILLDTTGNAFDESFQLLCDIIREHTEHGA